MRGAHEREAPSTTVPGAADWHALPPDAALTRARSRREGLSDDDAIARLRDVGPNTLDRTSSDGALRILWRQFHNPLVWVLIGSASAAMLLGKTTDGIVVLAVILANAVVGFVQEHRATRALEALAGMVPEFATAVRSGQRRMVPVADLVPGDIVFLTGGDKVPADMRVLEVAHLQVDEAALTGESVPVLKQVAAVVNDASLGDRTSMVYSGTLVTAGTGTALVAATGGATELGRISRLIEQATDLQTPLTRAVATLGRQITVAILGLAAVMLVVGTWRETARGTPLPEAVRDTAMFAIALAVGAIPEGLPAIVTIALAIGVQRMAARRAIMRKLPAVETLGSTTVICTDKTGTLTRNEMTLQAVWTPEFGTCEVSGLGYRPEGSFTRGAPDGQGVVHTALPPGGVASNSGSGTGATQDDHRAPADVRHLLECAALCSDASVHEQEGVYGITGDPTEAALVVAAMKGGLDVERLRAVHPRRDAVPFESDYQFMATLHGFPSGLRLLVKGAPEAVLARAAGEHREGVLREVHALADRGMRVLAVAARDWPSDQPLSVAAIGGLSLVGLVGMIDPPRQEAIEAVRTCLAAGIQVKMITGDHKATAAAIGRAVGLPEGRGALAGAELARLDEQGLRSAALAHHVFARVAPEHKLRLVKALQGEGHVVAMTGDGVNDAPALKQADIGVAMGITGTAVSKEAADVVLTDDNFATITAAVEEGRRTYDNLVKSLGFVLPTNLALAFILAIAVAFFPFVSATGPLVLPMLPTQLLWINLVATVALALPLAFEAQEPDIMSRPPRTPGAPVLDRLLITRTTVASLVMTAGAIALFRYDLAVATAAGASQAGALARAQSMAVTAVVMSQVFYLLNCRSMRHSLRAIGVFSNPYVFAGVALTLLLQATLLYAPVLQRVFGTTPLSPRDIVLATAVGAAVVPVMWIVQQVQGDAPTSPRERPAAVRAGGHD